MIFFKKFAIIILLCQFVGQSPSATGGGGTITFVQQTTPVTTKILTALLIPSGTGTLTVTSGNIITVVLSTHGGQTVSSISIQSGTATTGTFTSKVNLLNGTVLDTEIWTGSVTGSGTLQLSINYSATPTSAVGSWQEWSGLTQTTDGSSSANSTAPGSITTTNAKDLVIDCSSENAAAQPTNPSSPWISLTGANTSGGSGTSNTGQSSSYQITTATGSFNPTFTSAGQVVQVALKATATGGTSGPPTNFIPNTAQGAQITKLFKPFFPFISKYGSTDAMVMF